MGHSFQEVDGKPHRVVPEHVNLGLAVDVQRDDGSRTLIVPVIKGGDEMDFAGYREVYEELIAKTRSGDMSPDDLQGATVTLTNPGGIGTVASVPRLMPGQGCIVATGAIGPPAGVPAGEKVMTMTSTYDHRVIQGAESGAFLRTDRAAAAGRGRLLRDRVREPRPDGAAGAARHAPRRPPPRRPPPPRRRPRIWSRRRCSTTCRRRRRSSRRTACTATWPRGSTRSAPSRSATRRSSRRPSG